MGDSKEIKITLKDARQYIKDKEYKSALKEVKKVLNKDKNHYMALVFCGVCLAELDQPDQAIQAYKRATESSPEQVIAWEGLCKFYDKHPDNKDYVPDHIVALQALGKIVQIQDDGTKSFDIASKLSQLQLNALDLPAAIMTLSSQADVTSDQIHLKSLHEKIVKIMSKQNIVPTDLQNVYRKSLENLVHENGTIENMENLKHIIKLLYQTRDLSECMKRCVDMTNIFPQNIYPLEWICRIYLEHSCCDIGAEVEELQNPSIYIDKLIEFSSKNLLGNLARGQYLISTGETDEGIKLLSDFCKTATPDSYGIFLLTRAQYQAGNYSAAEILVPQAVKVLKQVSVDHLRKQMRKELNLINLKSLYKQQSLETLESQLPKFEGLLEEDKSLDNELCLIMGKVYASLGKEEQLRVFLSKTTSLSTADLSLIEALLRKAEGNVDVSEKLLEQSVLEDANCGEVLVLLGQINWNKNEKQKSLAYFLKAAKVDSSNWISFLYLGHYYRSLETADATEKARKCYLKCLGLNPHDADAGKGLSDIYRQTGLLQENLDFLTSVTQKSLASSGKSTWAWLRLGVHYLAADDPRLAVNALQSALRGDSSDINSWEALAEAYMARGSFIAAQKSFEKVIQLDPKSVYARLMIAAIKDRLGKWREGSDHYRQLLSEDDKYLPGLRGLGESLLNQAKAFLQCFVDRNAVVCLEEALGVLTKAAELNPSMLGTWRLIGDCCSLVGELPDSCIDMVVPSKLIGTEGQEEDTVRVSKEQVLELGSRAYVRGLKLDTDNWKLWHQLAVIYTMLGRIRGSRDCKMKALSLLKHTVKLVPGNHAVWNSLGLAAMQVEDWNLAQHSFIKSLEIEPSSSTWTHLGVLYLHRGDLSLANRALKEAQSCEPGNLRGWAGQALVAEAAGFPSESMDLFRHCTFLGGELESARGYANWALSTIRDMDKKEKVESHNRYIIEKMFGLAVAADSLTLYCRRIDDDALGFCQLSVALERQGLLRRALESAERSRDILIKQEKPQYLDMVIGNIARLQCRLGKHADSVATYQSIKTPTLESTVGLALAQYKLANYQESYEVYKSCLHWMAESQAVKSDILVAMGNLAYKVEGPEVAKTLLFQSCQITPPSIRGILALCVLGIQSSDLGLIDAALAEMSKHANNPRFSHDIVYLQASVLLLKGDLKGARRLLLRSVHRMPWCASHWRDLAVFLVFNCKDEAALAATCARKAGLLAQNQTGLKTSGRYISKVKGLNDAGSDLSLAESLVIESLCLLLAGDRIGCRRVASKLCHLYPYLPHSWALLTITGEQSASWKPRVKSHVLSSGDEMIRTWAANLP